MKNLKNFKALVTLCILRGASTWHFEIDVPFSKFLIELLGEVVEDSKWEENADRMCYDDIERTDYGFAVSFFDLQDPWHSYANLYYYKHKRVLEYKTFNNFWYTFKEGNALSHLCDTGSKSSKSPVHWVHYILIPPRYVMFSEWR